MIQQTEVTKINMAGVPENLVFGLDIGTRSIVGTIGYREGTNHFVVVAQVVAEHETRAMMDGQIHDINQVARTIEEIHKKLEAMTGRTYKEVCIAAAGRVLKTVETEAEIVFPTETTVDSDQIYTLDMLGVENAYELLREEQQNDDIKFYCVGYSVKHYYQNDYAISNLEGHKCSKIREELIATFLPDEVVDGLYAAVERAGLFVANLTLEPIAAINVAIPERFRLLNIALVDVGAGTSDISITKDGSIIAYGMIPYAGDEVTECLARHYLTDFAEADRLKCASTESEEVEFHDIMGLPQKVTADELYGVVEDTIKMITKNIADKIVELNGGKSVSAVFVVGGGGKVRGFVESLAEFLEIPKERVALRGSEVLGEVTFIQKDIEVNSLIVTPIGICMNYYEQRNNFIFVTINGERVKLYDNSKLTVMDAALQIGFPKDDLFPKRGRTLEYYVNGEKRMQRGDAGDGAIVQVNGMEFGMNAPIEQNDKIEIKPSTAGKDAVLEIGKIPEFQSSMSLKFNEKEIICPRFVTANGELVSEFYEIAQDDKIEILPYYTLQQVLEFMDIAHSGTVYVNNAEAQMDTKVYDNFSVTCEIAEKESNRVQWKDEPEQLVVQETVILESEDDSETVEKEVQKAKAQKEEVQRTEAQEVTVQKATETAEEASDLTKLYTEEMKESLNPVTEEEETIHDITITVNGDKVVMTGKKKYILVDVLDFYPIDTSVAHGSRLETTINGVHCDFVQPVKEGDTIRIQWVN